MKEKVLILTEEHEPSVRDNRVFRATYSGSISLMTKSFGRGTDFQVFDKNIQEKGGVHIIVTMLCMEEADEVQLKGRTNRQNSKGSVDIIFKKV